MKNVLIISDNADIIQFCSSVLSLSYNVFTGPDSDLGSENKYAVVLLDKDRLEQDPCIQTQFKSKNCRFLIIGSEWPEDKQIKALVNGAAGYCELNGQPEMLLTAVSSITKGDIWIKRHLVANIIGTLVQMKTATPEPLLQENAVHRLQTLSAREYEVAQMIQQGDTNKNIANKLNISERTVKAHLTSIFKKMNVPDRLHLALLLNDLSPGHPE